MGYGEYENVCIFRACSYGKKLSRLARKYFDSPNNFFLFIWEKLSRLPGKVSSCDVYTVYICLHRIPKLRISSRFCMPAKNLSTVPPSHHSIGIFPFFTLHFFFLHASSSFEQSFYVRTFLRFVKCQKKSC